MPVTVPTEWFAGIVPILKPNWSVHVFVNLTRLKKGVQHEVHPIPYVDVNLAKLGDSKIFSKLDTNSGFWQITLDDKSKLLATFVNRLPFGIGSAPEIFQHTMFRLLKGLEGTLCQMDDVFIHGANQPEHDRQLQAVLQEARLPLNDKWEFSSSSIRFLAYIIDSSGLHTDPQKTNAVRQLPVPSDVSVV